MVQEKRAHQRPLTFKLALWYGYSLAIVFLLYGGVKIVLSFMDNSYDELSSLILFALYGIILVLFAWGYNDRKSWGWYGMIGVQCLVILNAVLTLSGIDTLLMILNILLAIISAGILYCLVAPNTKKYLLGRP